MRTPLLHETLRQWNIPFAPLLTQELRHREPRRGSRWSLDEVCVKVEGVTQWLFLARTDALEHAWPLARCRRAWHSA